MHMVKPGVCGNRSDNVGTHNICLINILLIQVQGFKHGIKHYILLRNLVKGLSAGVTVSGEFKWVYRMKYDKISKIGSEN